VLVAVATYLLARRAAWSRGRAVTAGLIVAWYPGLLLYTVYVMAEPLYTLLMLAALLTVHLAARSRGALGAGAVAGLAALTRQAGVALVAGIALWAAVWHGPSGDRPRSGRRRVVLAAAVFAGATLAVTPWACRNYAVFGHWMPLETTGGITFLMANYEDATGRYLLSDWEAVHQRYLRDQPEEFTRNTTAYRLAFQKIAAEPGRVLALIPRRLAFLFDLEGREHLWLYTSGYFGPRARGVVLAAGWLLLLSFPAVTVLALVRVSFGAAPLADVERLVLGVLGVMLVQLLTVYGDPRFHLPLVPLLAMLAVRPGPVVAARPWGRRSLGTLALLVALAWWTERLPGQVRLLAIAAAPDGWQAALPY
jgi:hypothetical protein